LSERLSIATCSAIAGEQLVRKFLGIAQWDLQQLTYHGALRKPASRECQ